MKKRIFAILLALCMLFGAVPCQADELDEDMDFDDPDTESFDDGEFEEEEQEEAFKSVSTYNMQTFRFGDFVYKLTEDETGAILTSYTGEDSEVSFPSAVDHDIPVVAIDDGMCQTNPVIVNVTIPGTVQTIGNVAFSACPNLESVAVGEGLLKIGMCCFGGCPELRDVKLPDSLEIVDNFVFARCPALEEVAFGTQLKSIGMQAFLGCTNLNRITVPGGDGVTMGENLFQECPHDVEIAN